MRHVFLTAYRRVSRLSRHLMPLVRLLLLGVLLVDAVLPGLAGVHAQVRTGDIGTTQLAGGDAGLVHGVAAMPLLSATQSFGASADTYLRNGIPNTNEGGSTYLRVRDAGNNRALIRFDQAAIQA